LGIVVLIVAVIAADDADDADACTFDSGQYCFFCFRGLGSVCCYVIPTCFLFLGLVPVFECNVCTSEQQHQRLYY
jgi:hypothetical protein